MAAGHHRVPALDRIDVAAVDVHVASGMDDAPHLGKLLDFQDSRPLADQLRHRGTLDLAGGRADANRSRIAAAVKDQRLRVVPDRAREITALQRHHAAHRGTRTADIAAHRVFLEVDRARRTDGEILGDVHIDLHRLAHLRRA